MSVPAQTPAERKAAAREAIVGTRDPECDCEFCKQLDAYARACIDEAVAQIVRDLPEALRFARCRDPDKATEAVQMLGRLLTEGMDK